MRDLLRQWWTGYPKNHRRVQARSHEAFRQLARLVGHQLTAGWESRCRSGYILGNCRFMHKLHGCKNGRNKRSHRLLCELSGRFRETFVCCEVWTTLRRRDHGGGRESECTLRYGSASNGLAERVIRTIGEQLRTLRYDTQNRYKTRITSESTFWPWLVIHAGFCVMR